jgi:hypothetical protein
MRLMRSVYRQSVTGLAAACLLVAGCLSGGVLAAGDGALQAARQELRLRVETERRMRREFESLLADSGMSGTEISDFENYLVGLAMVVDEQRRVVAKLEGSDGESVDGSAHNAPRSGNLPADFHRGQTDAEKIAMLDAELGNSLSEFDEKLLREQQELAEKSRAASMGESGAGSEEGGGKSATAADGQGDDQGENAKGDTGESAGKSAGDGAAAGAESGQQSPAGESREAAGEGGEQVASAGGSGRNTANYPVPPDMPDGKDDDIVARQLREAAENEQDPELRAKLWEEYRNYKNSTR